jgi:hypothetical protein
MKNKIFIGFFSSIILLIGGYFLGGLLDRPSKSTMVVPQPQILSLPVILNSQSNSISQPIQPTPPSIKNSIDVGVKLNVPFVVQAPFGNWSDPIFQNACEESSIVMAMGWVNGVQAISPTNAQNQIQNIVQFENTHFGYNADTNVFDVQKIFQKFFGQTNVSVQENITIADTKQELQKGNLVLVPAFGQALNNPNYTAPGPIEHMLVVTGYDPATHEFITNDPGTRHGSGYRYNENVFFAAIWEYPSGVTVVSAPTGVFKKAMIVVSK